MDKKWYQGLKLVTVVLFLASMFFVGKEAAAFTAGRNVEEAQKCIVIDPGHGGDDPGKIGINGAKEKEINLEIAFLVKEYLEAADVKVIMTRETDAGLYAKMDSNKKVADMKKRVEMIEAASPLAAVSIHQNSYPEEYVHGAQVFYYKDSAQGKKLAESIQSRLIADADPENTRLIKENDSYYLLKKTQVPIVIVECGFLSNSGEAEKLCTQEYQKKVAWAIHLGILRYINQNG